MAAASDTAPPVERTLLGIQAARGVAALLVVLFHAERALTLPRYVGHPALGGATAFGHTGVDFFFVLSGFIIYYVHHADLGRPNALLRYAGRRAVRIYPAYWAVIMLLLLIGIAAHGAGSLPTAPGLARTLLLVPGDGDLTLSVAWTLVCEVRFYLLFGLAILDRRLAFAAIASCVAAGFAPWPNWAAAMRFWGFGWHDALFPIGIVAAWLTLYARVPHPCALATLGGAAFLAAGLSEDAGLLPMNGLEGRLAYGLASAMLIVGIAKAERAGRFHVGRGLILLGAASYSIYLVHLPLLGYAAQALAVAGLMTRLPDWCIMVIAVAFAIAAGIAFHLSVERPLARLSHKLIVTRLLPADILRKTSSTATR